MNLDMKQSVPTWRQTLIVVAALAFAFFYLTADVFRESIRQSREAVYNQDMDGAPVLGDPVLSPNLSAFRMTDVNPSSDKAGANGTVHDVQ